MIASKQCRSAAGSHASTSAVVRSLSQMHISAELGHALRRLNLRATLADRRKPHLAPVQACAAALAEQLHHALELVVGPADVSGKGQMSGTEPVIHQAASCIVVLASCACEVPVPPGGGWRTCRRRGRCSPPG